MLEERGQGYFSSNIMKCEYVNAFLIIYMCVCGAIYKDDIYIQYNTYTYAMYLSSHSFITNLEQHLPTR